MIQDIVGFLFIWFLAMLFFLISNKRKYKDRDYSGYPTIEARVVTSTDNRWVVEFENESGETVLGLDDEIAVYYFRNDIPMVKQHTKELVYYWPYNRQNTRYIIGGKDIEYSIHFCNPTYSRYRKRKIENSKKRLRVIGTVLAVLAMLVLFFGNVVF